MQELIDKVEFLEKLINLANDNYKFSIGLTWTILAGVVTAIGAAALLLLKSHIEKCVKSEVRDLNEKVLNLNEGLTKSNAEINNLRQENLNLKDNISKSTVSAGGAGFGFTHLVDGTHMCYIRPKISIKKSNIRTIMFPCAFSSAEEIVPIVTVLNRSNIKAMVENVEANSITISLIADDNTEQLEGIEVSILAIGKFKNIK